jgi:hypothetical protein
MSTNTRSPVYQPIRSDVTNMHQFRSIGINVIHWIREHRAAIVIVFILSSFIYLFVYPIISSVSSNKETALMMCHRMFEERFDHQSRDLQQSSRFTYTSITDKINTQVKQLDDTRYYVETSAIPTGILGSGKYFFACTVQKIGWNSWNSEKFELLVSPP